MEKEFKGSILKDVIIMLKVKHYDICNAVCNRIDLEKNEKRKLDIKNAIEIILLEFEE